MIPIADPQCNSAIGGGLFHLSRFALDDGVRCSPTTPLRRSNDSSACCATQPKAAECKRSRGCESSPSREASA